MEEKESKVAIGNLYDINKDLVHKYEIALTKEELEAKIDLISDYLYNCKNSYYMLLCHEKRDYTLFSVGEYYKESAEEVIDCLLNREGKLKGIDLNKSDAIEIWIGYEDHAAMYLLFPYDLGVIDVPKEQEEKRKENK